MTAFKHLEQLRIANYGKPVHPYFTQEFKVKPPKTAAQLEALIEELVNLSGGKVSIINSGGRQLVTKQHVSDVLGKSNSITTAKYIPSTTVKGTPDILGCMPDGRALAVEVKFSKTDRMSKDQLSYKAAWKGVFVVARCLDDVLTILNESK